MTFQSIESAALKQIQIGNQPLVYRIDDLYSFLHLLVHVVFRLVILKIKCNTYLYWLNVIIIYGNKLNHF